MPDRLAQILTASHETCEYIWRTPFRFWLENCDDGGFFWIQGKPGSGKSVLMKHLLTSPQTKTILAAASADISKWHVVYFFFDFRASRSLANTTDGLFRSLLQQIVRVLPFSKEILTKYQLDLDHILICHLLEDVIRTIVKILDAEMLSVLLLVDGLDESESNICLLIQSLKSIHQQTGLRIFFASRPEPLIVALLRDCPTMKLQEHNAQGVEAFVRGALSDAGYHFSLPGSFFDGLIALILERTKGVYLWANYAVEMAIDATVRGLRRNEMLRVIMPLPGELGSLYDRIFERVPVVCRSEAALILLLVDGFPFALTLRQLHDVWRYLGCQIST